MYQGPKDRQDTAQNLPLKVGSAFDLWEKMMKEVKMKGFAGPFDHIPFPNYVQLPVGLIKKKEPGQTRIIFHLSFNFPGEKSINHHTPQDECTVKYRDLDHAI